MTTRPASALACLCAAALVALACKPGVAQSPQSDVTPFVPDDYLDRTRRLGGDTLRFCASSASALTAFDEDVAREVAASLLLDFEWTVITYPFPSDPFEFQIWLAPEALFEALSNRCDVFTGYTMSTVGFPEWLTTTVSYLDTRYVLATPETGPHTLADLPADTRIGTRLGSSADAVFAAFLASQPEPVWRRAPYPHHEALLGALAAGTIQAAIVWEPALSLAASAGSGPSTWHILPDAPSLPTASFGMVTLRENAFLRDLLDNALAALEETGVLAGIARDHGVAPTAP